MKLLNFIKKNVLLVAAFATVIGFSAFKVVESNSQAMVTLYFHGDTDDAAQVEEASNWKESSTPPSCLGEEKACSITVHQDDVTGSSGNRQLDPNQIILNAVSTGTHFIPEKNIAESNSSQSITVHNKD